MALIRIEKVYVAYGRPPRPVLEDLNLEIAEGEFVTVLGQTGCGKSTLLRLVLGSEQPLSGRVLIDGQIHAHPDSTRGYVPQKYPLFPDKTVLDNITFGPEAQEFGLLGRLTPRFFARRREFREEAMQMIRRIGLREADAHKYPDQLSGGMQQRVAIAQALITRPRILLMDEAFSALDPAKRRDMQQWIRGLWESTGTTMLFVTHNTHEALVLGTRLIVLARDAEDQGSRLALDFPVPTDRSEGDILKLIPMIESAAHGPLTESPVSIAAAAPGS